MAILLLSTLHAAGAYSADTNPPLQVTPNQAVHKSVVLSQERILRPNLLTVFRKLQRASVSAARTRGLICNEVQYISACRDGATSNYTAMCGRFPVRHYSIWAREHEIHTCVLLRTHKLIAMLVSQHALMSRGGLGGQLIIATICGATSMHP